MKSRIIVIALIVMLLAATTPIGSPAVPVASAQGLPSLFDYDKDGDGLIGLAEVKIALDDHLVYTKADRPLAIAAASSYLLGKSVVDLQEQLFKSRGVIRKPLSRAELEAAMEASRVKLAAEAAASSQAYMAAVAVDAANLILARQMRITSIRNTTLASLREAREVAQAAACQGKPAPVITSLRVDHGQPGDPVLIDGQNFGDTRAPGDTVHFLVASGTWVRGKIEFWSPTQILVTLPDTTGLANSYQGVVKVNYCGMDSNLVQFRWEPAIEVRELDQCIDYNLVYKNCWDFGRADELWRGGVCYVYHYQDLCGCENDDTFYDDVRLINNWVVDRVEFGKSISEPGEANAWVKESHVGTNNPFVKVHFYANRWEQVEYWLKVYIKGPAGTQAWEWLN